MANPDARTLRARFEAVDGLARLAQGAVDAGTRVESSGDGAAWRPGAHGDACRVKPALAGDGYRFALSRLRASADAADQADTARVAAEADRVAAALAGAGCAVHRRTFESGDEWVAGERGAVAVVVKLAPNGNRLVTAESRDFGDATFDEAAARLGTAAH